MLELEEKHSKHWKKATVGSLAAAAFLFMLFQSMEDPFLEGIVRMASFIFLCTAVICALKVMEGRHKMRLKVEDGFLVVTFHKNEEEVQRNLFELKNISRARITSLPPSIFSNYFFTKDMQLKLDLNDSDRSMTLFEINGRTLSVNKTNAQKAVDFLHNAIKQQPAA